MSERQIRHHFKEYTQLKFCGGVDSDGGVFREGINMMQRADANCCVTSATKYRLSGRTLWHVNTPTKST